MIPHRVLNNEFFGNGLRQRVTACRKRLRTNRHHHRLHLNEGQSSFTSEVSVSFPAESDAVRESLIGSMESFEGQQQEAWIRPEEEVGRT